MEFAKAMAKLGVWYVVGTAASTVGLLTGLVIGDAAMPVVEQKSKKFFSKFMDSEEE